MLVGSRTNSSLAGGGYLSIYSTITVPAATASGTYYVLFVADPANLVTETNENNNVATAPLQVVAPSIDLTIFQAFLSPPSTAPGNNVNVS